MGLLIPAETLASHSQAMLFDCWSYLDDLTLGKKDFDAGRIPRAQHANLDRHQAAALGADGWHPLPEREAQPDQFQQWEIHPTTRIICYDQNNGAFPARLWWLCHWLGHDDFFVLAGGLDVYIQQGHPVSPRQETSSQGHFAPKTALKNICHVTGLLRSSNALVEARDRVKYRGEIEPTDPVDGHISGAISAPFFDNISEGYFKPSAALKQQFATLDLTPDLPLLFYSGSGVTATHNLLALLILGYPEPALYPRSWSEWITDPDRPIETA